MAFSFKQKILFKHCDPAGIVFYPRYFEIINDCVEDFFDKVLKFPFEGLLKTGGVPTAAITTQFKAPSFHGDHLDVGLKLVKLGRTSIDLELTGLCEDETRFTSNSTLVFVDQNGRPTAWPSDVREKLQKFMEGHL